MPVVGPETLSAAEYRPPLIILFGRGVGSEGIGTLRPFPSQVHEARDPGYAPEVAPRVALTIVERGKRK